MRKLTAEAIERVIRQSDRGFMRNLEDLVLAAPPPPGMRTYVVRTPRRRRKAKR